MFFDFPNIKRKHLNNVLLNVQNWVECCENLLDCAISLPRTHLGLHANFIE